MPSDQTKAQPISNTGIDDIFPSLLSKRTMNYRDLVDGCIMAGRPNNIV